MKEIPPLPIVVLCTFPSVSRVLRQKVLHPNSFRCRVILSRIQSFLDHILTLSGERRFSVFILTSSLVPGGGVIEVTFDHVIFTAPSNHGGSSSFASGLRKPRPAAPWT